MTDARFDGWKTFEQSDESHHEPFRRWFPQRMLGLRADGTLGPVEEPDTRPVIEITLYLDGVTVDFFWNGTGRWCWRHRDGGPYLNSPEDGHDLTTTDASEIMRAVARWVRETGGRDMTEW